MKTIALVLAAIALVIVAALAYLGVQLILALIGWTRGR